MPTRTPRTKATPDASLAPLPDAPEQALLADPVAPPRVLLAQWLLGVPKSLNHMYGRRSDGGVYLTAEAAEWRISVAETLMLHRQALTSGERASIRQGGASLALDAVFTGARADRADIDNLMKLVLDGMKVGLMVDDRHVSRLGVARAAAPSAGATLYPDAIWLRVSLIDHAAAAAARAADHAKRADAGRRGGVKSGATRRMLSELRTAEAISRATGEPTGVPRRRRPQTASTQHP